MREQAIPYDCIPWPDAPQWLKDAFIRRCKGQTSTFRLTLMSKFGMLLMDGDKRGNVKLWTQYPETLDEEKRRIEETRAFIEKDLQP